MSVLKDSINHSSHPIPNWFISSGHKSGKGPWWLRKFVPVSTANSSFYMKASAASGKQIKSSSKLPLDMDKKCLGGLAGLIPAGTRPPAAEPLVQCFNIWSYCPWVKMMPGAILTMTLGSALERIPSSACVGFESTKAQLSGRRQGPEGSRYREKAKIQKQIHQKIEKSRFKCSFF